MVKVIFEKDMKISSIIKIAVCILVLLMLTGCSSIALPKGGIEDVLNNLYDNIQPLIRLAVACAYVSGFMLVLSALYKLRIYGEVRTMMPSHAQMSGPAIQFVMGLFLLFLPTIINMSVYTIWHDSVMAYPGAGDDLMKTMEKAIIVVIKLFGFVAVIRGVLAMSKSGNQGAQPGLFTKGLVHFVGGILAINVWGTVQTIGTSLGLTIS